MNSKKKEATIVTCGALLFFLGIISDPVSVVLLCIGAVLIILGAIIDCL